MTAGEWCWTCVLRYNAPVARCLPDGAGGVTLGLDETGQFLHRGATCDVGRPRGIEDGQGISPDSGAREDTAYSSQGFGTGYHTKIMYQQYNLSHQSHHL